MERSKQKLDSLLDLCMALGQQTEPSESLRLVTLAAKRLFDAEHAAVMMVNPHSRETLKSVHPREVAETDPMLQRIHTHVSGWVLVNHKPFSSENLQTDPRFNKKLFRSLGPRSVMAAALNLEGVTFGVIMVIGGSASTATEEASSAPGGMPVGPKRLEYLTKFAAVVAPFLRNAALLKQYFSPPVARDELLRKYAEAGLLGRSDAFIGLLKAMEAASQCDVRVLLEGSSGTGKELVARAIHAFSARSSKPFIAVDCGAIPENLVESELFGHVRGAFTGARMDRKGLIAEADGGTLFMDEIANLPMEVQAKLMRALQEGEVRPVGSDRAVQVDVRIIAASSSSLQKLTEAGGFREDLYYRLHVYPIRVPSLEERRADIPLLANHFLRTFARKQNKQAQRFHEEILDFMQVRSWKGNIRELENMTERLVALAAAECTVVGRECLPPDILKEMNGWQPAMQDRHVTASLEEKMAEEEAAIIREALLRVGWNQSRAARLLKISPQTLRYKMKKHHIRKSGNGY